VYWVVQVINGCISNDIVVLNNVNRNDKTSVQYAAVNIFTKQLPYTLQFVIPSGFKCLPAPPFLCHQCRNTQIDFVPFRIFATPQSQFPLTCSARYHNHSLPSSSFHPHQDHVYLSGTILLKFNKITVSFTAPLSPVHSHTGCSPL